jgi:hypothetical protein
MNYVVGAKNAMISRFATLVHRGDETRSREVEFARKGTSRKTVSRRSASGSRNRHVKRRVTSQNAPVRQLPAPRVRPTSQVKVTDVNSSLVEPSCVAILACPGCGLQAPEKPMAEHFLGCPSHKLGLVEGSTSLIEKGRDFQPTVKVSAEDSRESLRYLLQILVPPRAFGRRHEQKRVNPISLMFESCGKSGASSIA